jgi:hypothetical protein
VICFDNSGNRTKNASSIALGQVSDDDGDQDRQKVRVQYKNQQAAGNQDEREDYRLWIGEMAVIPLLQNFKHDVTI